MSWAQAVSRARAVFGSKAGLATEQPADAHLPMRAHLGALVSFKVSSFLRAADAMVKSPAPAEQVCAVSKLHLPMQGSVHRLYFERGDDGASPRRFLQLYTDPAGDVREVVYFSRLLRLIPGADEETQAFLGEGGQGLGQCSFFLYREQLEGLGLPASLLDQAFGSASQLEYLRSVGAPDQAFVEPFRGSENRVDDAQGVTGLHQDVVLMTYERTLASGAAEQLLICTEILQDQNGSTDVRELHVDFMVGLPIPVTEVTVQ